MYLSITESKKMLSGPQDMPQVSYEKHKIFLFQEDFEKFGDALADAFKFVKEGQPETPESQGSSEAESRSVALWRRTSFGASTKRT